MSTEDGEPSLADLGSTVRTIVAKWENPRDTSIWPTVKRLDRDLSDALDALAEHVRAVGGAPEPAGYPAERRVADLEKILADQHRRADALHHARKAWGEQVIATSADEQARGVLVVAQAFERYLTDGTIHEVPDASQEGDNAAPEPVIPPPDGGWGPKTCAAVWPVLRRALDWVDRAHLKNPSGLENWRNWADDHDVDLINAVLAYRGLPPLERKQP